MDFIDALVSQVIKMGPLGTLHSFSTESLVGQYSPLTGLAGANPALTPSFLVIAIATMCGGHVHPVARIPGLVKAWPLYANSVPWAAKVPLHSDLTPPVDTGTFYPPPDEPLRGSYQPRVPGRKPAPTFWDAATPVPASLPLAY